MPPEHESDSPGGRSKPPIPPRGSGGRGEDGDRGAAAAEEEDDDDDAGGNAGPPAVRSKKTLFWVSSTYLGEGLPWSFLHQMATEFLTEIGASKTQISSTSLLHLAVTFKFAWAPIVDLFGRKRTWLVLLQILLGLGMFAVALAASTRTMSLFWWLLGVMAVVHATHDIACDGFYLQALRRREQALFAGVRTAAFRGAMIIGSMSLVYLAAKTNWLFGFGGAGCLMIAIAAVNALVAPRPDDKVAARGATGTAADNSDDAATSSGKQSRAEPPSKGVAFLAAYRTFFAQPQAGLVLSFMFFYKLGDIMMFAMSKPLLRDIGVDTSHRAFLNGAGTASFVAASILGGAWIAKRGLARCLIPMTYFQNLAIPLYIAMAVLKPPFLAVVPIVLLEQFAAGIGATAHVVFLMQRSRSAFSASHYAFATAVVALASTLSGFLSGPLNERLGHPWFFTVAFILSWPSLALVLFVPKTPVDARPEPETKSA